MGAVHKWRPVRGGKRVSQAWQTVNGKNRSIPWQGKTKHDVIRTTPSVPQIFYIYSSFPNFSQLTTILNPLNLIEKPQSINRKHFHFYLFCGFKHKVSSSFSSGHILISRPSKIKNWVERWNKIKDFDYKNQNQVHFFQFSIFKILGHRILAFEGGKPNMTNHTLFSGKPFNYMTGGGRSMRLMKYYNVINEQSLYSLL